MRSIAHEVAQFFNTAADNYDALMRERGFTANTVLAEALGATTARVVLDLGAGTGATTDTLLQIANPERIVAVDASEGMLSHLRQRHAEDQRVQAVQAEVSDYLANTDDTFDLIAAVALLYFLPDQRSTIGAIARRLKPGGRFGFMYDPIIPGMPIQHDASTTYDNGVTVYRMHPRAITDTLQENGLRLASHAYFISQLQGNTSYRACLAVAQRPMETQQLAGMLPAR